MSSFWARTMSATVMTGKERPQTSPVAGLISLGPAVPMQPPSTLAQSTKYRSVSMVSPGPTMGSHQPSRPVCGLPPVTYWSPESAWQTRTAFDLAALSLP